MKFDGTEPLILFVKRLIGSENFGFRFPRQDATAWFAGLGKDFETDGKVFGPPRVFGQCHATLF